ncbi:MAG: hypothetical protein HGB31_05150 [Erysipelotrichaceae bacterium]|nr:hypothetical protein [Erysipelotrichaceae bacterium]
MDKSQFDIDEQTTSGLELSIFEKLALLRRNLKQILIFPLPLRIKWFLSLSPRSIPTWN